MIDIEDYENEIGNSILHTACKRGEKDKVINLINNKFQLDILNNKDNTPIMECYENRYCESHNIKYITMMLLKEGATFLGKNRYGNTLLHLSCRYGNYGVVAYILKASKGEKRFNIHKRNYYGYTAMMYACFSGNLELIKLMVEYGASIFDRTYSHKYSHVNNMNSCICAAANSDYDNPHIIKYLLDNGCNINDKTYYGTPIYLATSKGNILIVETLLDNGSDIDNCNINMHTPLHVASINGHLDIIRMLLSKGAKYLKNNYDRTPKKMTLIRDKNAEEIDELFDIWPVLMIIFIFIEEHILFQLDFTNMCDLYEFIGLAE